MMEKHVKMPVSRKKMPKPSLIWRFLSALMGTISAAGGGDAVFLVLLVVAIVGDNAIKIQYSQSKKRYLVFGEDLFCVSLCRYFIKLISLKDI